MFFFFHINNQELGEREVERYLTVYGSLVICFLGNQAYKWLDRGVQSTSRAGLYEVYSGKN